MSEKYNGWTNYETWNVALWIGNDEGLYSMARECKDYDQFVQQLKECSEGSPISFQTPDGVSWTDSGLDTDELDNMIAELSQ